MISWESTDGADKWDILAPGVNIMSIDKDEKVNYSNGTSQATALINGYIALLKDYAVSKNIEIGFEEIEDIEDILVKINHKEITYTEAFTYVNRKY